MTERKVFVSYARADVSHVARLANRLEAAGTAIWRDQNEILGGQNYGPEIVNAIKTSSALLVCCSNSSMRSKNVKQEIQLAWHYDIPYVPVILEAVNYPEQVLYWMEGWQWIEILDRPEQEWLPRVLQALKVLKPSSTGSVAVEPTSQDQFQSLWSLARLTDQIWPVLYGREDRRTFRDIGASQDDLNRTFPIGSRLRLAIELERAGHLLLLDRGTSGRVYCLCPSLFAPEQRLEPGLTHLPTPGGPYDSFLVTGQSGREHLLAIVAEAPILPEWGSAARHAPARLLSAVDEALLVAQLRDRASDRWTTMSTFFEVTA